jgi:hypothetical protein
MALQDNKSFTTVTKENWVLLLEGEGIITNMGNYKQDLKFRFDTVAPQLTDVYRIMQGTDSSNKNSFTNYSEDSKIYGRAATGSVEVLVTREVV